MCFRVTVFHQVTQQEKGSVVGNSDRLLHVVCDNDNGIFFFQFCSASSSILEVEIGSRALVGSSIRRIFGFHGEGPRNAETLLLAAR